MNQAPSASMRTRPGQRWLVPLLLVALVFGLYLNTRLNLFADDDSAAILDNPDITTPRGLLHLWVSGFGPTESQGFGQYQPITVLTLNLAAAVEGYQPDRRWFGATNVALVAALGLVAGAWMRQFVTPGAAWLAAMLFVAHPSVSEAVNLVIGRAELLALIGVLGFLALQKQIIEQNRWTRGRALLALLAAIVAVGSSTTGLLVVPLALVQTWVKRSDDRFGQAPLPRHVLGQSALILAGPVLLYVVGRSIAIGWSPSPELIRSEININPLLHTPLEDQRAASLSLAWAYARGIFWPDISYNRLPAELPGWSSPSVWVGLGVLLAALVVGPLAFRRRGWLSLAWAMGVGQFLLVSHLLVISPVYAGNRLMLPMVLAVLMALATLISVYQRQGDRFRRLAVAGVPVALLLVVSGWAVLKTNGRWFSPQRLAAADNGEQLGNPVTMYRYGTALAAVVGEREQQWQQPAVYWLRSASELRPESVLVRRNLAGVLHRSGDVDAAAREYERILALDPTNAWARRRLEAIGSTTMAPPHHEPPLVH